MNVECSGQSGQTFGISQQDFRVKLLLRKKEKKTKLSHRLNNKYVGIYIKGKKKQVCIVLPDMSNSLLQPFSLLLNM